MEVVQLRRRVCLVGVIVRCQPLHEQAAATNTFVEITMLWFLVCDL